MLICIGDEMRDSLVIVGMRYFGFDVIIPFAFLVLPVPNEHSISFLSPTALAILALTSGEGGSFGGRPRGLQYERTSKSQTDKPQITHRDTAQLIIYGLFPSHVRSRCVSGQLS